MIIRDWPRADVDGAWQDAPDGIQVADRCHLWQNLVEALDQVCYAHGNALEAVHESLGQAAVIPPGGTGAVPVPPPTHPRPAQKRAHQQWARRRALHQPIGAYHQQGWPGWAIAQPLGVGKHTLSRDLRTETSPVRKRRTNRGRSLLSPYTASLLDRWNAGCRDALRLFRELQPRDYPGSDATVARYVPRLRHVQGEAPRQRRPHHPLPIVTAPPHHSLTLRRAT